VSAARYEACPADCECDDCYRPVARPVTPAERAAWASHDAMYSAWMAEDEAQRKRARAAVAANPGTLSVTL